MKKHVIVWAAGLLLSAGSASAQSSFTESCSSFGFAYAGNNATLQAMCLKPDGTPHATSMVLTGIVNVNGVLTDLHSGMPSTFQSQCGSIAIFAEGPIVTLSAYCRTNSNQFSETSIQLNNIDNSDGNLVQSH